MSNPIVQFNSSANEGDVFEFVTNSDSGTTFDPIITKTSGVGRWDFGDGSGPIASNNISRSYSDGGDDKTVKLFLDKYENLEELRLENDNIKGTIDLSVFTGLKNTLLLQANPLLTGVTLPVSSGVFTFRFFIRNCDITGEIDASGLTGLGADFRVDTNANLTGLTLPVSSQVFTIFGASSCDLRDVDMSGLTGLGGNVSLFSNSNLTGLTFPISNQNFISIIANACDLGYVDFNPISGSSSDNINIRLENNNMTADPEVDRILVDLDTIGWTGGTINISGTNAAPTAGGTYNGVAAKSNLITKSWTVTTN